MSKVFWDSMLFIHLVEDHPKYAPVVRDVLSRCFRRNDNLYTSHLSIAETLVGLAPDSGRESVFLSTIKDMGFALVEFGGPAVKPFRALRRDFGLKPPDAMNLACAAATGVDLYVTGDQQLLKKQLYVPGVHFIADFERAPL